eukprot:365202-Chlamydomonas_euryale.AAC.2
MPSVRAYSYLYPFADPQLPPPALAPKSSTVRLLCTTHPHVHPRPTPCPSPPGPLLPPPHTEPLTPHP